MSASRLLPNISTHIRKRYNENYLSNTNVAIEVLELGAEQSEFDTDHPSSASEGRTPRTQSKVKTCLWDICSVNYLHSEKTILFYVWLLFRP